MIKHFVAFSFADDVTDAMRKSILDELDRFPSRFPAMRRWASGVNFSARDATFAHAFSVEFEREADLVAYLESPEHEEFVRERFRPNVARRVIVSFEAPDEDGDGGTRTSTGGATATDAGAGGATGSVAGTDRSIGPTA